MISPSDLQPPAGMICQGLSPWRYLQENAQVFLNPAFVYSELKVTAHGSVYNICCSPFSQDGVVKAASKNAVYENEEMLVETFVILWPS